MFFSLHFLYFALTTVRVHFHICKGPYKGPYEWTHCSQQFWLTHAYVSPLCVSLYISGLSPPLLLTPSWTQRGQPAAYLTHLSVCPAPHRQTCPNTHMDGKCLLKLQTEIHTCNLFPYFTAWTSLQFIRNGSKIICLISE